MRTVRELRSRYLAALHGVTRRPSMYGGDAWGVELFMSKLLSDLCFLDERDEEWEAALDSLQSRGQFTCRKVTGSFLARIGEAGDYADEVASVYAAEAHRLGYLDVDSTLTASEFGRLRKGLRAACREQDWRVREAIERFGPPSISIGSILAYVPGATTEGWICFDFDRHSTRGPDRDYLLRNVRVLAGRFNRSLTFTPHGRRSRRSAAT